MQGLSSSFAALYISALYVVWRAYWQTSVQQALRLRKRVTYMLWVAANLRD